jgi:hypothetical protein
MQFTNGFAGRAVADRAEQKGKEGIQNTQRGSTAATHGRSEKENADKEGVTPPSTVHRDRERGGMEQSVPATVKNYDWAVAVAAAASPSPWLGRRGGDV